MLHEYLELVRVATGLQGHCPLVLVTSAYRCNLCHAYLDKSGTIQQSKEPNTHRRILQHMRDKKKWRPSRHLDDLLRLRLNAGESLLSFISKKFAEEWLNSYKAGSGDMCRVDNLKVRYSRVLQYKEFYRLDIVEQITFHTPLRWIYRKYGILKGLKKITKSTIRH